MINAALSNTPAEPGIIDVHAHALLPVWRNAVAAASGSDPDTLSIGGITLPDWTPELHISYMDRHGIDAAILSMPGASDMVRGTAAAGLCRAMNEAFAEIIAKYPTRFGAFANVPLDDIEAASAETEYALDTLKLDGITSSCHFDGTYLGDSRYDPWFAELDRRQAVLFVHPSAPKAFDAVDIGVNVSALEFMFDTTRFVTNMVASGARMRFPEMRVISTHGGGTIPYLANRLVLNLPVLGSGPGRERLSMEQVQQGLASFHYDLTAATSPAQLDAMRRLVPASQLMVGYDWPMMPEMLTPMQQAGFAGYSEFSEDDRAAIRSRNALRLFPLLDRRRS